MMSVGPNFKPRFWRPGTEAPGWKEERNEVSEYSSVVYNQNASLSIDLQRQKLPIFNYRNHILYLLENYQTLIIVGETGCGKSTQVPQYLLESDWMVDGKMVAVTEPRRIAATSVAGRVADERSSVLGLEVGYSIRFDDCYDQSVTKIKYMTEGILVREMMADPLLKTYSIVMMDEVHERSIYSDIVLGLVKKILKKRSDLRLIVSSATLESESFHKFFNRNETDDRSKDTATILTVEGRNFPVDIFYVKEPVPNYVQAAVDTVIKIHQREPRGHVLVFLTGQEEVEHAVSLLIEHAKNLKKQADTDKLLVLPMYGALPAADQIRCFQTVPRHVRKVIVSTNIAEASITIDGIAYVVDCGFVKLRYFNPRTGTDALVVVPVSQASAEQRAGRAGRVRAGKVYRLYKEEDFYNLLTNTPPEIQRCDLSSVVLQLKAFGIDNILRFDFPAAPPSRNVISALELLFALGAIDDNGHLSKPLGEQMAEFPLHPMFSKVLLMSGEFGCSEEVLTIVAMLQVQNIFVMAPNKTLQVKKAKYGFSVLEGDLITMLNVYLAFIKCGKSKSWCSANFLNYKGLVRATEIRTQLAKLLGNFKINLVSCKNDVDAIRRNIVVGFFANAAYLHYTGEYRTIRGDHPLHIHPSSVLYTQKQPQWVIFCEVLHTSKEYMRDITVIEPSWLYELAPHYYQFGTDREITQRQKQDI